MKRNLVIAAAIHALILSVTWVGFSVPLPRSNTQFFYQGSLMPAETVSAQPAVSSKAISSPVKVKTTEGALFAPWIQMRDLNKPKR